LKGFEILWSFGVFGFLITIFAEIKMNKAFILLFSFFSFLTVLPGFHFRSHYFVTLLPAISLLIGIFIDYCRSWFATHFEKLSAQAASVTIFLGAVLVGCASHADYFVGGDVIRLGEKVYGPPFAESIEIAKYIETRSVATDTVAVFGSEPQIYFYSKRHSATGYIYTYSLMEDHEYNLRMQKEMIKEIEGSKPRFFIAVNISMSWLARPASEKYIFEWAAGFIHEHYSLVGVVDIVSPDRTVYRWNSDAATYDVQSRDNVLVFERRGA
jgi:hypothetical protein